MLTGYADEHVKAAIVAGLRNRGMDVVTVQERGQRESADEILLESATSEGRLLLTNDTDFLRIHTEWMSAGRDHAGIVYWHQSRSIGQAIQSVIQYALLTPQDNARNMVKFV
jgi:hypothetical protein